MSLILQLFIGGLMIVLTVIIHAAALDFIIRHATSGEKMLRRATGVFWRPLMAAGVVLTAFLSHILQIWLWTLLYVTLDCVPNSTLSDALYFSTVTYTTVGYGDITLKADYRMLSGIEAANGILLIGWTTAYIFEVISQLYRRETKSL